MEKKHEKGLIIGKFMPLHRGHQYLIDFGRNYADDLYVMVCSIRQEPIPGNVRYEWVKEAFPDVNVIHNSDENPQYPEENMDFWDIWKKSITSRVDGIDLVFASEKYGEKLAGVLGAEFIPVDISRKSVHISGTAIRENPMLNWEYIHEAAKPYFAKKICIFGPESTGKSSLAENLARHFNTVFAGEYGREYLDKKGGKCQYDDIDKIARGQIASEDSLIYHANRVFFTDTDILTTEMWSNALFGKCPEWIEKEAEKRNYDLYLLLDTDVPFVPDEQRYLPDKRQLEVEVFENELEKRGRNYTVISGSWDKRFEAAIKETERLIDSR